MKYVLDSNVALKWVLPEQDDEKAIKIRDDFKQGIHVLISPDIFPSRSPTRSPELSDAAKSGLEKARRSWPTSSPTCLRCTLTWLSYQERSPSHHKRASVSTTACTSCSLSERGANC